MIFYIAKATDVKPSEVVQVLDDERRGFYSDETGKIYVSDNANQNAKETATTVAHEASHSIDAEAFGTENKSDTYKENREEYAQLIDDAFADKLDQEYASDGYDLSTITHQNSNTQVNSVTNQPRQVDNVLASNTEDYNKLDKSKGENFLPALVAVPAVAGLVTAAIANPKVQEVTKQALNNAMEGLKTVSRGIVNFFEPDAQYTDEELAIAAKTYLQMREYRDTSTNMGDWVAMDNLMQQISPEVAAAAEKLRAEGISSNTGGSEIVEGGVTNYTNPVHEGMDSSTVSVADKDQDVWTTETHVTDEKGLGTTESPADFGVDVPLVVVSENSGGDGASHPNGVYEDASYHGSVGNSVKSKAPTNGQHALDNALSIGPNTDRKIAVSNGEFVVLDQTRDGLYHGHVRAWKDLNQQMQSVLRKAGLVTKKGKIK